MNKQGLLTKVDKLMPALAMNVIINILVPLLMAIGFVFPVWVGA